MTNFAYTLPSKTAFYNGYVFDSLLEIKYSLMIEDSHAWLRDGIEIYYGVNIQPSGIKAKLHCYRPDFLIRNLSTGEAELIEVKPDGFNCDSLRKRKRIAEKFIKCFAYDWKFRVVTESEILLSSEQWLRYEEILSSQQHWRHQPCLKLLQNNTLLTDSEYELFVRSGLPLAIVT